MIQVKINNCEKKFQGKPVFTNFNYVFEPGTTTAITGKNGSGKSTLLKIIAAFITPTKGDISWIASGNEIDAGEVYRHISMAAPYIEMIEEFSFPELVRFHNKFKTFNSSLSVEDIIAYSGFSDNHNKPVKYFSSGMKQRAGLALAMLSSSPLVLLDEPCANLDNNARSWYAKLHEDFGANRTIIIASNNNQDDYPNCNSIISL